MLSKMAKLTAMTVIAAGAAIGSMAVPTAHAAMTQNTRAVTTRSVHGNVTPNVNGCSPSQQNGWNISVCSDTETFEAWGDAYVNSHGPIRPGCIIEITTFLDYDQELYDNYPCSTFGHIGPLTYTGFTLGSHVLTTVTVRDNYGTLYRHSYQN